jgi:hypothetical protein
MHRRQALMIITIAMTAAIAWAGAGFAGELPASVKDKLASSTYVYISSQRKDGHFGKPAEIWFMYDDGAVWVGTLPTSWRVKRIKAGRTTAKIAVGTVDGPSFEATGSLVTDPKMQEELMKIYAKKYPDGWATFSERFRKGFQDGSRVLVKYVPK